MGIRVLPRHPLNIPSNKKSENKELSRDSGVLLRRATQSQSPWDHRMNKTSITRGVFSSCVDLEEPTGFAMDSGRREAESTQG